jgi:hypothetical protein
MQEVLRFLSDDTYSFQFVPLTKDRKAQTPYFEFHDRNDWPFHKPDRVLMFTFSHAIDNVNDPLVAGRAFLPNFNFPHNTFDLAAERGNSDFDIRHRGVVNFIYELNLGRGKDHLSSGFVGVLLVNVDTTVLKNTHLTERFILQFRLEAHNLFNHAQFSQPDNQVAHIAPAGSPPGTSLANRFPQSRVRTERPMRGSFRWP